MFGSARGYPSSARGRRSSVLPVLVGMGLTLSCGARTELRSAPAKSSAHYGGRGGRDAADATGGGNAVDAGRDASLDAARGGAGGGVLDSGVDAPRTSGCADGEREGFVDTERYPAIAGCSGGFQLGGVSAFDPGTAPACPTIATRDTSSPACGRTAGDDGPNPTGRGCNVADLCELGWHVCASARDVTDHSPTGCADATRPGDPPLFFVTRQSSDGCGICATGTRTASDCDSASCASGCALSARTSNDVFGCGNFGGTAPIVDCGPLDRFTNDLCGGLAGSSWSCQDDGTGKCEAYTLAHTSAAFGGALCCRD